MSGKDVRESPGDGELIEISLTRDQVTHVLAGLALYAHSEEYDKGNSQRAEEIQSAAVKVAYQATGRGSS